MQRIQKMAATIFSGVMMLSLLVPAGMALAQNPPLAPGAAPGPLGGPRPINPTDLGIQYGQYTGLGQKDIRRTVADVIRVAMGLLGIVAVVIILIGGFTWMTAGGNEEKVGEAKKYIFSGIIGLAIILSAYAIATFVVNSLVEATSGTSGPGL